MEQYFCSNININPIIPAPLCDLLLSGPCRHSPASALPASDHMKPPSLRPSRAAAFTNAAAPTRTFSQRPQRVPPQQVPTAPYELQPFPMNTRADWPCSQPTTNMLIGLGQDEEDGAISPHAACYTLTLMNWNRNRRRQTWAGSLPPSSGDPNRSDRRASPATNTTRPRPDQPRHHRRERATGSAKQPLETSPPQSPR